MTALRKDKKLENRDSKQHKSRQKNLEANRIKEVRKKINSDIELKRRRKKFEQRRH